MNPVRNRKLTGVLKRIMTESTADMNGYRSVRRRQFGRFLGRRSGERSGSCRVTLPMTLRSFAVVVFQQPAKLAFAAHVSEGDRGGPVTDFDCTFFALDRGSTKGALSFAWCGR